MRQRPVSVMIFGILNIGFALLGFVGVLVAKMLQNMSVAGNTALNAMRADPTFILWNNIHTAFAFLGGMVLIASGAGLLLMQNWARLASIAWAVFDIVLVLAGSLFSYHFMHPLASQFRGAPATAGLMGVFMVVGVIVGLAFSLAYPILLLIFMSRPKFVAVFEPAAPSFVPPPSGG